MSKTDLHRLIDDHIDQILTPTDQVELERCLDTDPSARRAFISRLRLEGQLRLMGASSTLGIVPQRRPVHRLALVVSPLLAAAAVLMAVHWGVPVQTPARSEAPLQTVAMQAHQRQVTVQVLTEGQPTSVVTALRPGHAPAQIGQGREHVFARLQPQAEYRIQVIPLIRTPSKHHQHPR